MMSEHRDNVAKKECTVRKEVPIAIRSSKQAVFISFDGICDGLHHIAIRIGIPDVVSPLVRIHSECLTGDIFGSARCDCGAQLNEALDRFAAEGGYLLYLRQEGRGIGLIAKLDAYLLQDSGLDTFEANEALALPKDGRDYLAAAQMLKALNIKSVKLLTNNNLKSLALKKYDINVVEQIPTLVHRSTHNYHYLRAKIQKQDHTMILPDISAENVEAT